MSNTSTIETYDVSYTRPSTRKDTAKTEAQSGLGDLLPWLALSPRSTDAQREAQRAEIREIERECREKIEEMNRLDPEAGVAPKLATLNLYQNNLSSLVKSVAEQGYQVISSPSALQGSATLLQHANGSRAAITINPQEKLSLHATNTELLRNLANHHTQRQVNQFLTSKGIKFQSARLPGGELQILAHEPVTEEREDVAQIKAQVGMNGETWIDIDQCRGNRCETIVQQFAEAIGGRVTSTSKKDAYFEMPGEPAKTQIKL